jgi:hypothetical protein
MSGPLSDKQTVENLRNYEKSIGQLKTSKTIKTLPSSLQKGGSLSRLQAYLYI